MIHERFAGSYFHSDVITTQRKKQICLAADIIFAISQSTKNDVIEFLDIEAEKIVVTHLSGANEQGKNANYKRITGLPEDYILFVGYRNGYKNFVRFVQALQPLLSANKDLYLLCTGPAFTPSELELFISLKLSGRVLHYFAVDEELFALYHFAQLFVFPSEYEGFGIPAIEAMSVGCPTLLSTGGSLPEIGAEAAMYFNPQDQEEMTHVISRVLHSESFREEMKQKGLNRAAEFSWDKTVEKTLEGYRRLMRDEG